MRRDSIDIRPYDARWPGMFSEQRTRLEGALGSWVITPIEHIGSTSIPGLAAKPIIDMLALVDDYDRFSEALPLFEPVSWLMAPEPGDAEKRRYSVCYPSVEHRTHHLHVVERDGTGWPDWMLFRDFLRAHPDVAADYGALKRRLAGADPHDRPAYRAANAPFIQSTLSRARAWEDGLQSGGRSPDA